MRRLPEIYEILHVAALSEYFNARAAGLPAKGIAALTKDGEVISAGPIKYENGHEEDASEVLMGILAAKYSLPGSYSRSPQKALAAMLVIEGESDEDQTLTLYEKMAFE